MSDTEREVRRVFDEVLKTDVGQQGAPDTHFIREEGRRVARRRLVRSASVATGVLAVAGAVTLGMLGTSTQAPPSGGTALAGAANNPSKPPTDLSKSATDTVHSALMNALGKHLPAGLTLEAGTGPTSFTLRHADGTTSTLSALEGLQKLGGAPSPCPRYGTDCQAVMLPDGSRGWASKTLDGREVSVALYTLNGQAFGLSDGDMNYVPGENGSREKGAPMSEGQLITLVQNQDVYTALKKVPTDQVSPEPSASASTQ